ncbi:MAG: triose-phosphate isomerase [Acidobacteria bacterium]|nr:triose-phosphate isomerase [Acidobacteriota bacterium]MBV9145338.1 triose-phosphate isomerase [Acidobacteriota bacterium]MBV9435588.1 triose-phosphate isomerase [Acidobacteriota bacterium]
MRRKLIAANWKMHKTPDEARAFVRDFAPLVANQNRDDIALFPPFISIPATIEAVAGTRIGVGAQNMHWEKQGAFTGEISAAMLICIGCSHVIIGHSERRQYFLETDVAVNRKLRGALEDGLLAIVCVGELFEERESGLTEGVLRRQVGAALREISGQDVDKFCIAYEPVWAIGTGKTATPQIASDAHAFIRAEAAKEIGDEAASKLRILYGGSVKPENAHDLMSQEQIDGALVGGASLDPKSFAAIVKW